MTPHNREELLAKLNGRIVVCSVSGGKDSTAMCLYLQRDLGLDVRRVHCLTGWDAPETLEYIRGPLTAELGPITEVSSFRYPGGMVDLIESKGMFPTKKRRFCTEELKIKPLAAFHRSIQDDGAETVGSVGIRAGESEARAKMSEWEWTDFLDADTWRPILSWTEADVIDIHSRYNVAPNPLYIRANGAHARVGCVPCFYATKDALRVVADQYPEQIVTIRRLEAHVREAVAGKVEARQAAGEELRTGKFGFQYPTFFYNSGIGYIPVDDAVRWSRTSHGGKQFELFHDREEGCVRWGLCESMQKDDEETP